MQPKIALCRNCILLQTANVVHFQRKNPIILIFWVSGWFAVPVNPDKWSSTVPNCCLARLHCLYAPLWLKPPKDHFSVIFIDCIEMFISRYMVVYHKRFIMNDKDKKGFNMNEPSQYVREFRLTPFFINCPKCSGLHTTITRVITARLPKKFHTFFWISVLCNTLRAAGNDHLISKYVFLFSHQLTLIIHGNYLHKVYNLIPFLFCVLVIRRLKLQAWARCVPNMPRAHPSISKNA